MEISLFWNVVFVSALSLGFFVAIVLFYQYIKSKNKSQLYLGAFVFVFSTILLNNFAYWNQAMDEYPHFIFSTVSTRFLLAPLFYLYCKTFLDKAIGINDWIHFVPFIVLTLIFSPVLTLSGAEKIELIISFRTGNYPWWSYFTRYLSWALAFQLIAYPCLIYYKLSKYIKTKSSSLDKNKHNQISWLYFFNSLVLLYGLLMLFYFILIKLNIGGIEKDYYISLVMCIAIYGISYIGMDNPELLRGSKLLQRVQKLKYSNTNLEEDYLKNTIARLEQLMETEKVYLESDINLHKIAQKTNIPRHHISQALNQHLGKTFHDFINYYRVEHACRLLRAASSSKSIKTIMYESGFNNRASFNNNFKKFKGMTASAYMTETSNL